MRRLQRLRAQREDTPQVRLEKTDHGWRFDYVDSDPEQRYQPIPPKKLRRLQRDAEERYRIRQQQRALADAA